MSFKVKKIVWLILLITVIGGLILFWLWDIYSSRRLEILSSEKDEVLNQYSATINSYRLVSKTIFDEVVNTKEVIELLKEANKADTPERNNIRKTLEQKFKPVYARLKGRNFKQLDLFLADTTNFVNMLKLDDVDYRVSNSRTSIKRAMITKAYMEGFEEGKLFNGFRYIFPIVDSNGTLLGILETGVSFEALKEEMSGVFPLSYRFILKKQVVGDMIFSGDVRSYEVSDLNKEYYYEWEKDSTRSVDSISPETITEINRRIKNGAKKAMDSSSPYYDDLQINKINYLVTLLPINNLDGEQVAYVVAYRQSDEIYLLKNDLYLRSIFVLALICILIVLTYYIYDSQQKLLAVGERLHHVTMAMSEGLMLLNFRQEIIFFNPAAQKITGFTEAEVMDHPFNDVLKFVREDGKKRHIGLILDALQKGLRTFNNKDVYIINKDADLIPLSISAAPLVGEDDEIVGCLVVFRDTTEERQIDKTKTEFVSLASHQLKTPLSAINWYAEMLTDGDVGQLNDRQKDFVKEIIDGNKRMVKLVNSLLNVSRIDMGTLSVSPEPINLSELFDSVISEQDFALKAKDQTISKKYDPSLAKINLDPNLMRIVAQNLVSNAIKYTKEGGAISVELKKQGNECLIKVTDNGYGIPKSQQPYIFTKLFRADNVKSKKVEGTGLGLYVAKAVVEAFGGKIWFESIEDKGTTFYITLPLSGAKVYAGTRGLEANT